MQVLATQYMPELEALKQRLDSWRLMGGEPEQPATPRPAGTVQLAASNMPQLHWEAAGGPEEAADVPSQPGAAERNDPFAFPSQRQRHSRDPCGQAQAPFYPGKCVHRVWCQTAACWNTARLPAGRASAPWGGAGVQDQVAAVSSEGKGVSRGTI